jgi:hypothetical protein
MIFISLYQQFTMQVFFNHKASANTTIATGRFQVFCHDHIIVAVFQNISLHFMQWPVPVPVAGLFHPLFF